MGDKKSFVIKGTLGLTEPFYLKIGAPGAIKGRRGFSSRSIQDIVKAFAEEAKSVSLNSATPQEAVQVFLRGPIAELNAAPLIHWGSDGKGLVLPKSSNYNVVAWLKEAQSSKRLIAFAYTKEGDLPVMVFGYVRSLDLERGLVSIVSDRRLRPKSYLTEEIIGLYDEKPDYAFSWLFDFQPLSRGRTKVTVTIYGGFRRKTINRGGKPSTMGAPQKPLQRKVIENLTELATVEPKARVGEILEFVNADGQRIGLRVQYIKGAESLEA